MYAFALISFFLVFSLYSQNAKDAISLYNEGYKAQILEEYYRAIELYKSSLEINPNYASPMKGLARCFYMLSEYDEALAYVLKAKKYDKTDLELYNLEGLIRIGRGESDLARSQFNYVLSVEPNNINAQFGLAELDIAHGKTREAARKYIGTLNHSPNNRTALLELVEIYKNLGEIETAKNYLELALKYHADDPVVHYAAGKYFYEIKSLRLADYYLKTAIALKKNYYSAKQLLGIIYFLNKKYDDAKTIIEETLSSSNPNHLHFARYCLGLFNQEQGNPILAAQQYIMALDLRYDDEVARIASEIIALKEIDIKNHIRKNLARYHYNEGLLLEEQNYLSQTLMEYRRSLMLDYDSEETRVAYARIFKKLGFPVRYLMELKVLRDDYKSKDPDVLDELELNLMHLYDSVSYKWMKELKAVTGEQSISDLQPGDEQAKEQSKEEKLFDQYTIQQKKYRIMLFIEPDKNTVLHPFADRILLDYFKDLLFGYRTIDPSGKSPDGGSPAGDTDDFTGGNKGEEDESLVGKEYVVHSFDRAFRKANENKSDYFLIIRMDEKERSFEIVLTIYLTRTGSELKTIRVFKTGNRRVQDAFEKCAENIHGLLPLRGTLLTRRFNKGIIDLGRFQGVKKGDELLVIKKQKIKLDHRKISFVYEDSDVLGTFTVTEADENVSEGIIKKKSFFDFINPEDEVIFQVKDKEGE